MPIDELYPRASAYVRQLPAGLDSYPRATAKGSIVASVQRHAGEQLHGLPGPLQARVDHPDKATSWIPACHSLALVVAIVESRGLDRAAEAKWVRGAATSLFSSSLYRILMWAASPRLIMKQANVRWSAFFQGCALRSALRDRDSACDLFLEAPVGLFNEDLAMIFTDVLGAAVDHTEDRTASTTIELVAYRAGAVHYVGRW